jgi:hypothetical protein
MLPKVLLVQFNSFLLVFFPFSSKDSSKENNAKHGILQQYFELTELTYWPEIFESESGKNMTLRPKKASIDHFHLCGHCHALLLRQFWLVLLHNLPKLLRRSIAHKNWSQAKNPFKYFRIIKYYNHGQNTKSGCGIFWSAYHNKNTKPLIIKCYEENIWTIYYALSSKLRSPENLNFKQFQSGGAYPATRTFGRHACLDSLSAGLLLRRVKTHTRRDLFPFSTAPRCIINW